VVEHQVEWPKADERALWQAWSEDRSEAAVEELWRRCQRIGVAVARRTLQGVADVDQEAPGLVDEVFVKALRTYDPERAAAGADRPFRGWFLRLVRTASIDQRRKRARDHLIDEPDAHVDHTPQPVDARLDIERIVAHLEAWNRAEGLAEDWPVLLAWLQCRHDGIRVPWKTLAAEHPVVAPADIPFQTGSALLPANEPAVHAALRKLDLCPRLVLDVLGGRMASEPSHLAGARGEAVEDALRHGMKRRRVSSPRGPVERVSVSGGSVTGARASFDVRSGGHRSPDSLRMRVEKVILGKVLALYREEEGR